ncbi:hypothetical protein SAMN05421806_10823 [Streptomyces indicus]|uniref:Uncharacterized protein n=1 Tax=Streptomyces indicus TaxID=417292 RepID=A0A1G9CA30_9ACTN|nr:hypothetical protein SAMN05421806_10823 [Streptomyces indicus]
MRGLRKLYKTLKGTHHAPDDDTFAKGAPCRCSPNWPALESTANGYTVRALPSAHYSIMTNPDVGTFVARCTGCHARYLSPWIIDTTDTMPYAWARETD